MDATRNILAELDRRRRDLGMTCQALADRSGLTVRTVQRALRGGGNATLDSVAAMADALGVSIGITGRRPVTRMRSEQARAKARRLVAGVQGSSGLEAQAVSDETCRLAEQKIAARLLRRRSLWDE